MLALFTVMTFNAQFDSAADDASLALLAREAPDVVCVQELTPRLARRIEHELASTYPHRALFPKDGTWGIGLLSKHPIARATTFAQAPHRMPALEADVEGVRLACVHLFPPGAARFPGDDLGTTMRKNAALRVQQAHALAERYRAWPGPLVVMGDMNEGEDDDAVRVLVDAGFALACKGERARCGGTWPGATSPLPAVFAIDHVLGKRVTFTDARVIKAGGSDHYPVAARVSAR